MYILKRLVWHIKNEKNLLRWALSRFLFYTGSGQFFTIDCGSYKIRFFPSAVSLFKWVNSSYGADDERFFARILRPNDIVVDVGANIGTLTLCAASVVGEQGRVIAFEPHPRTYDFLKRNIYLNRFNNVTSYNCAIGDKQCDVYFSSQKNDDQNKVVEHGGQKVLMATLDSQLSSLQGRIKLLKVDTEGYEKLVFIGAKATLARTDYIYFEVNNPSLMGSGYDVSELLSCIKDFGFNLFRMDENGTEISVEPDFVPENYTNIIGKRL